MLDLPDSYENVAEALIDRGYKPNWKAVKRGWGLWATTSPAAIHGITVPAGFVTDGASIPRAFRWLFSRVGAPHQVAALLHDYMYSEQLLSRADADRAYLRVCLQMGVGVVPAKMMFYALVGFGGAAWRSNGRKLKKYGSGWRSIERVTEWI